MKIFTYVLLLAAVLFIVRSYSVTTGVSASDLRTIDPATVNSGTDGPTPTPTATPTVTPTPVSYAYVTVGTDPAGLRYEVNGVTYDMNQVFQVPVPGGIVVTAISPQAGPEGTQFAYTCWNIGCAAGQSLAYAFQFPTHAEFIALYRTQYRLTMIPPRALMGSVSPGSIFIDAGQQIQIRAFNLPGSGYVFSNWIGAGNGAYSGPNNPVLITMNGPIIENAVYVDGPTPTPTATPTPVIKTAYDYDGDLRSDISVFRRSEGNWYLHRSGSGTYSGIHFGTNTDRIAPADYDGDHVTDIAVYRPETAFWYILNSSDGTFTAEQFGTAEDLPTAADYDGDERADLAVFRPSNGNWYITNSTNGSITTSHYGQIGDKPTPGDYNGDRRADYSVFRPSNRTWYNSTTFIATVIGDSTDLVAPADYDGDGKTDMATYRPSLGLWRIKKSAYNNTLYGYYWGVAEDIPAPADYDGDGVADLAVFRPSEGTWYIINSSSGTFTISQFGQSGDMPTQNAFNGD